MLKKITQTQLFKNPMQIIGAAGAKGFYRSNKLRAEVEVFIDDKPIKVDSSYTIFQACMEAGVEIPRFCYHERLAVAGNCRMCLVEVEKSPKPIASCSMPVMPGMRVNTKSEKTRIARGGVMEFLLANHPLDCPICDQGGECDLQDISQVYGYREGRFVEYKRAVEDKQIGPLIKTIMNRCIHCSRCIRFSEEIAGEYSLGMTGRGRETEVGTYIQNLVHNELSGNTVDLCPVGALTNAPYAFTARPWELRTTYSIDVLDGLGSNIEINHRGSEIMRILPRVNESVNEEWIGDKSRHSFDGLKRQRLNFPMKRRPDGSFAELTWEEAFLTAKEAISKVNGDEISGMIGPFMDLETIVAFRDLMHKLGCENIEVRSDIPKLTCDVRGEYLMNSRITGVDDADLLLIIGSNPRIEAPVFNARIRRAVNHNNLEVAVVGGSPNLTYDYSHLGNSTKTLIDIAEGKHPYSEKLKKAKFPMIIVGSQNLERQDGRALLNAIYRICETSPVVNKDTHWNGFNILHKEASRPGALDLGIAPYKKDNKKPSKLVYLLGADDMRVDEIPNDAFVIYQGHTGDEGAYFADLIFPGAAYTEKAGTYVNTDGRVQLTRKATSTPGLAREDWAILRALSEELGTPLPYDNIEEIRIRLGELAPHLLKYDHVEPYGFEHLVYKSKEGNEDVIFSPLNESIDNYYMTDAISRNSAVMAKCSKAFNTKKLINFKQPGSGLI